MANVVFNAAKLYFMNGSVNLATDTVKGMLVTSTYAPNIDTHTKRSDVTNEVTGTGYTAGGTALANKTTTQDNVNDRSVFDADDLTWAASTITARGLVLYKSRGGAATADEIITYLDFGADIASTNGLFTVQFNAVGIMTFS